MTIMDVSENNKKRAWDLVKMASSMMKQFRNKQFKFRKYMI